MYIRNNMKISIIDIGTNSIKHSVFLYTEQKENTHFV